MSDRADQVIADAEDGLDLDRYTIEELVAGAIVDYKRGPTPASIALGFALGSRGWLPTREEHEALGLSPWVKTRD